MNTNYCAARWALAAILGGAAVGAQALTITGFSATFDCTHMAHGPFTFQADRNNTGSPPPGAEMYRVEVRDGAGQALYSFTNPDWPIDNAPPQAAGSLPYSIPPTANPITFTVVSLAGNGFPEQLAVSASGSCSTLPPPVVRPVPTLDTWALGGLGGALLWLGIGRARRQRRG